ncbi:uncharacterized protein SAPINGB_P006233 [Magnusiomyces paraingens]|uniref:Small-subunit processome Utp12 domain-containing protein n=1 Tax=Magnusiomyces paraingens TaxID=2606893 RepID=A0A5E8CB11_9ASCO|nr:uncharacterized protein SAPINGB_P006233 [Saprochaete ingens]VVT58486.1 unnamed protein product [Saprochaete ingens]
MVQKDYYRFEQEAAFGVIESASNVVWLPPTATLAAGGRALVGSLETASVWDLKTGTLLSTLLDTSKASSTSSAAAPEVTAVASFGGQMHASGYSDGTVKVWDATTGEMQVSLSAHRKAVTTLVFDASGTRLVSGSRDTNLVVWDLVNEVGLWRLRSHKDAIVGAAFVRAKTQLEEDQVADAEDQTWLVSASKDGTLKLWDLETQHCVETKVAHSSNDCWSLEYSPALETLITGSGNKELAFWKVDVNAPLGSQIVRLGTLNKQSGDRANTIKVFNGGEGVVALPRYLAVASADRSIEVFKIKSSEEIKKSVARKLKRRRERGLDVADGGEFALSEDDITEKYVSHTVIRTPAKVRSFDFAFGELDLAMYEYANPNARDIRPQANTLVIVAALANNALETYSVAAPMSVGIKAKSAGPAEYSRVSSVDRPGHRTDIRALSISSDDRMVASASNGQLKVWNVRTRQCIRTFDCGYALCCSFLPGDGLIVVGTKTGDLELFDVASSTLLETVNAHIGGSVWALHVSPDGKSFVTAGGADKSVKFWSLAVVRDAVPGTSRTVARMKIKHTRTLELDDDVMCVRLSPDMRVIAVALLNSTVKVFFVDSLKFALDLYGHKLPVLGMDISTDSKLLVTCSADKNIKLWGLDFGDCHRSIFAHQESIMGVVFDPLTDLEAGGDTQELKGHTAHNFFSVSKDKLVKYWDGDNFQQLQALAGHHGEVWALAVAHSGDFVVTGSHDKSIRVWHRTDEQLFLVEERDRELEEQHEQALTAQYDADAEEAERAGDNEDEEESSVARASKTTIETLKAGERLLESLDLAAADMVRDENTPQHIILSHKGVTGPEYALSVLSSIRPQELEDAVLVLPLDRVLCLLELCALWLSPVQSGSDRAPITRNKTAVVCRALFTVLRVYHRQIAANIKARASLEKTRLLLRKRLADQRDRIGYNIAGLKTIKETWDREHRKVFVDEREQDEEDERHSRKRIYASV